MLDDAAKQLMQISRTTEADFLALGDRIGEINQINSQNLSLAKSVSGELINGRFGDLQTIESLLTVGFGTVDTAERLLDQLSGELTRTVNDIGEIMQLNDLLGRTYRSLRMIRVMIRIETESAGATSFHNVAEALVSLESRINQNAEQIGGVAQQTRELIGTIIAHFGSDWEDRRAPLKNDRIQINESIAGIREKLSGISAACEQMAGCAQLTNSEIGTVVMNLQFHDNYRQRLEHVVHALADLQQRISAADAGPDSLKPWLIAVARLQLAQLENLRLESHEVSRQLNGSFEKIRVLLEEQVQTAELVVPLMNRQEAHVGDLEGELQLFCDKLEIYRETDAELLTSVNQLEELVSGITGISSLIKANELSLRLLALNSIIKATAIGRRGRSLAVLSKEINAISQSVQLQIANRDGILESIHQGAENIISNLLVKLRDSIRSVGVALDDTSESLQTLLRQDDRAEHCSATSRRLQRDFSDLMRQFAFSEVVDRTLNDVMENLKRFLEQVGEQGPGSAEDEELTDLELKDLLERYTMQSERNIHRAAGNIAEGTDATAAPQAPAADEGLDDNIELF